jgi:hypothetical protein
MGRKKTLLLITILLIGIVWSPYSLNVKGANASTAGTKAEERKLDFYSAEDITPVIKSMKNDNKDDSIIKEKQFLNEGKIKVEWKQANKENKVTNQESTDIAYSVNEVKKSPELQKALHDALIDGKKVYLYGGLTFDEYRQLLNIDEITIDASKENSKPMKVHFGNEKQKGPKKENPHSLAWKDEDVHDIIGYTIKDVPQKLFVSDINVSSKNGTLPPTTKHYIQEILNSLVITVESTAEEEPGITSFNFLRKNAAKADSKIVKSNGTFSASAYYNSLLLGRIYTDWYLKQSYDESDGTYDYFTVEDYTQIQGYNGGYPYYLKVDHDIPYDSDHIYDWDPDDDSDNPYNISIGFPWSISFSFNLGGEPTVNEIGSLNYDYGRWEIKNGIGGSLKNGDRFKPATSWKSYGTYASMDIRHWCNFTEVSGNMTAQAYHKLDVDYDYTTPVR